MKETVEKFDSEIDKYEEEKKELLRSIEVYESYIQLANVRDKTEEQETRLEKFCQREGIKQKSTRVIANTIRSRIEAMRERIGILDRCSQVEKRYKNIVVSREASLDNAALEKEAREKSNGDSDEYNRILKKLKYEKTKLTAKEEKERESSFAKIGEEVRKVTKKTGFFGRIKGGLKKAWAPIYNLWCTVHNANARFQKKHPKLNAIIKFALPLVAFAVLGSIATAATGAISTIATLGAFGALAVGELIAYRHIILGNNLEEHDKMSTKEATPLKELKVRKKIAKGNFKVNTKKLSGVTTAAATIHREAASTTAHIDASRTAIPKATAVVVGDASVKAAEGKPATRVVARDASRAKPKPKTKRSSTGEILIVDDMREKLALCRDYSEKLNVINDFVTVFEMDELTTGEQYLDRRNTMQLMYETLRGIDPATLASMTDKAALAELRGKIGNLESRINRQLVKDNLNMKKIMASTKAEKRSEGEVRK